MVTFKQGTLGLSEQPLVKGGDWPPDTLVRADFMRAYGGRVYSIPFRHRRSISDRLRRIRRTGLRQPVDFSAPMPWEWQATHRAPRAPLMPTRRGRVPHRAGVGNATDRNFFGVFTGAMGQPRAPAST